MVAATPKATTKSVRSPKRNQTARRSIWSVGWVMPKVRKKAMARASRKRISVNGTRKGCDVCVFRTSGGDGGVEVESRAGLEHLTWSDLVRD